MPDKENAVDKRFEISIPYVVQEIKDGQSVPFFDCKVEYHDVGYDGLVAIQTAVVEMLNRLNGFGLDTAEAMGLGKKMEMLGVGKKNK